MEEIISYFYLKKSNYQISGTFFNSVLTLHSRTLALNNGKQLHLFNNYGINKIMKKKDKKLKTYHEVKEPQAEYHAFKDMDVNELANKILKAIGNDAQKRATLIGLLVSDVATKQDFATILAELKEMRKASCPAYLIIGLFKVEIRYNFLHE